MTWKPHDKLKERVSEYRAERPSLKERMGLGSDEERAEQLERQADALEREADSLEGTMWAGDMSPSQAKRMQADEKREHALLLRQRAAKRNKAE